MQIFENKSNPALLYDFLSYMRDLGKRECLNDKQLDDAKKMIKWATAVKSTQYDSYKSLYLDSNHNHVYLHKYPEWFKNKFVSLETLEVIDKSNGNCCNFCDTWTINKGECKYCYIGRYQ